MPLPDAEKERLKADAHDLLVNHNCLVGTRWQSGKCSCDSCIFAGAVTALLEELAAFTALEKHLPEGFAIGDDATAELAIKLTAAEAERDRMRLALEELIRGMKFQHNHNMIDQAKHQSFAFCGCYFVEKIVKAEATLTEKGVTNNG